MKKIGHTVLAFGLAAIMIVTLTPMPFSAYATEKAAEETAEEIVVSDIDQETETVVLDDTDQSDGDLFLEYLKEESVQKSAKKGNTLRSSGSTAGSRLTDVNRAIYDYLNTQIELVAAGELGNTEFMIPMEAIAADKEYWTSEDLGAPVVVDNQINADAVNAFSGMYAYEPSAILHALMVDNPYELYWYDKTQGTPSLSYNFEAHYNYDLGEYVLIAYGPQFSLPVAKEYSATGEEGTFESNTAIGQSTSTTIAKANSIVQKYASATDYNKLKGFCDEICSMVTYNHDALEDDVPYGNPWQLIWVFDDDSSTNIVCEGYSKAFQFLCDLSDFENDIRCITVYGVMSGGTGEGGHMWNVVAMDDGDNYLVDVTNCDSDTIGHPYQLFLAGYSSGDVNNGYVYLCDDTPISYVYDDEIQLMYGENAITMFPEDYSPHVWDEGTVTKAPTCTETGIRTHHCSEPGCDHVHTTIIPATGHTEEILKEKAPTCTESGLTEGVKCSVCGEILTAQEEIPALGHTEETLKAKAPTCTESGLTDGLKCSVCGEILTAQEEIPALGHTEEILEEKAPACTESGLTEGVKCSVCGEILTAQEEIPALGHTEEILEEKAPTCTESGLTEGVKCSVCGEILTAQEEIPALGHTEETLKEKAPTCTESGLTEGVKCSVCGEILTAQEEIPALGHDYVTTGNPAVDPTCTAEGHSADKQCSRCSDFIAGATIPALGHTEETLKEKAPTCTESGLTEGVKCSVCGEILTAQEEIPALGHDYQIDSSSAKDPTYTDAGKEADQKCSRCGDVIEGSVIPALGQKEITPKVKLSKTRFVYNGKVQKPAVTVSDGQIVLTEGVDYTVGELTSKRVGKYTVKVSLINAYKGSGSAKFTIVPKGTSISKVTPAKKGFTVKWKKQRIQTTGYQIQYATSSKFKSGKKLITIKKTGTISKKVTKLKAKKKYYVRVRTFKTVNGTKYYSAWSKTKTVKTR